MHQLIYVIPTSKTFYKFVSMFVHSPLQVVGNSYIKHSIVLVAKYIDVVVVHACTYFVLFEIAECSLRLPQSLCSFAMTLCFVIPSVAWESLSF
ncbi:MAG: hypothetical protein ACI4M5_00855 [Christensenellales bacterium]